MDFTLIAPAGLRDIWPRIREGLDLMPPEDWIPEDVYHLVKSGDSALYIGTNEHGYAGFIVLRMLRAEFSGEPRLHCWLAHNVGDADVFAEAENFVKQTAANAGAKRITFGSPRKGWAKRYPLITATYEVPR